MNVIEPQAGHQHTGLQLVLDYIVKGSGEGSKNCKQFTEVCIFVSLVWSLNNEIDTRQASWRRRRAEKHHFLTVGAHVFHHQQRTLWAPALLLTMSNTLLSVTLSRNDTRTPVDVSISLCHFGSDSFSLDSYSVDGTTSLIHQSWRRCEERREEDREERCSGWRWEQTCQTYRVSFSD